MSVQQASGPKAVIELADSLSEAGKVQVLEHLLNTLQSKNLHRLPHEGISRLRYELKIHEGPRKPKLPACMFGLKTPAADQVQGPFSEVYSGVHCKLEVGSSRLGLAVRLTFPAGSTLENAFDEINQISQEKYGRDAIYRGKLYTDDGVKSVKEEATVITFIPVFDMREAHVLRTGKNPEPREDLFLERNDLTPVERRYLTAAAGAFRVAKGFEMGVVIGSPSDKGDLLQGLAVYSSGGGVSTNEDGVGGFWRQDSFREV